MNNYYKHDFNSTCENPKIIDNVVYNMKFKNSTINLKNKDATYNITTLQRPSYKKLINDVVSVNNYGDTEKALNKITKRTGENYKLERPSFHKDMVYPRYGYDFNGMEKLNIQQNGIKIQLGNKTLNEMFRTQINDPTDINYKQEGRPQRKVYKYMNIADSKLNISEKINVIQEAVRSDPAISENKEAVDRILNVVLGFFNLENIQNMEDKDLDELISILSSIKYSSNWRIIPNKPRFRFLTWELYENSPVQPYYNILLSSPYTLQDGRPPTEPIEYHGRTGGKGSKILIQNISLFKALGLLKSYSKEKEKFFVLDLENNSLIPFKMANEIVQSDLETYKNEVINYTIDEDDLDDVDDLYNDDENISGIPNVPDTEDMNSTLDDDLNRLLNTPQDTSTTEP